MIQFNLNKTPSSNWCCKFNGNFNERSICVIRKVDEWTLFSFSLLLLRSWGPSKLRVNNKAYHYYEMPTKWKTIKSCEIYACVCNFAWLSSKQLTYFDFKNGAKRIHVYTNCNRFSIPKNNNNGAVRKPKWREKNWMPELEDKKNNVVLLIHSQAKNSNIIYL